MWDCLQGALLSDRITVGKGSALCLAILIETVSVGTKISHNLGKDGKWSLFALSGSVHAKPSRHLGK